jgi:hypothetical protein
MIGEPGVQKPPSLLTWLDRGVQVVHWVDFDKSIEASSFFNFMMVRDGWMQFMDESL